MSIRSSLMSAEDASAGLESLAVQQGQKVASQEFAEAHQVAHGLSLAEVEQCQNATVTFAGRPVPRPHPAESVPRNPVFASSPA